MAHLATHVVKQKEVYVWKAMNSAGLEQGRVYTLARASAVGEGLGILRLRQRLPAVRSSDRLELTAEQREREREAHSRVWIECSGGEDWAPKTEG